MGSSDEHTFFPAPRKDLRIPSSGETAPDDDLIIERQIRLAHFAARLQTPISSPVEPLSLDELYAPLEDAGADEPAAAPTVKGFEILSKIGEGGQGVVYGARQLSTGRRVAIKVLAGGGAAAKRRQARFDREASLLAALDHPNIVGIVDRGTTDDGSYFIAMQYVDGVGLEEHLRSRGREPRAVAALMATVADAVGEAHARGIVHRDLKPSNILVDRRGRPHVVDFGLARLVEEEDVNDAGSRRAVTRTGQILGSLPWLSPEQARGAASRLDARGDVYALGVVFYQALSGGFPYRVDGTERDVLNNIVTVTPTAPSGGVGDEFAAALDAIVLRALSKSPHLRYRTASELAADVRAALKGERSAPPRSAFAPWRWRRLWGDGLTGLLLGLTFAAARLVSSPSAGTQEATEVAPLFASGITVPEEDDPSPPTPSVSQADLLPPAVTGATTRPDDVVNSVGMRLIRLSAGEFWMGSPSDEAKRQDEERLHRVVLTRPFYLGQTEVTQAQYVRVMGRSEWDPQYTDAQFPADEINWHQATEFCEKLSKSEHRTYRLPTEAEWEYACRAGGTGPFGDAARLDDVAWYSNNSEGRLRPVGTKRPNAWRICDMLGNVAEWCSDVRGPYSSETATNPTGATTGFLRVLRGGSIDTGWDWCRPARRIPRHPGSAGRAIGFRVVMEGPTGPAPGAGK